MATWKIAPIARNQETSAEELRTHGYCPTSHPIEDEKKNDPRRFLQQFPWLLCHNRRGYLILSCTTVVEQVMLDEHQLVEAERSKFAFLQEDQTEWHETILAAIRCRVKVYGWEDELTHG